MRRSLAKFSESEVSNHTPSLADFTTTTPELKFPVHTGDNSAQLGGFGPNKRPWACHDFQRFLGATFAFLLARCHEACHRRWHRYIGIFRLQLNEIDDDRRH
jgi:hypothetical protein